MLQRAARRVGRKDRQIIVHRGAKAQATADHTSAGVEGQPRRQHPIRSDDQILDGVEVVVGVRGSPPDSKRPERLVGSLPVWDIPGIKCQNIVDIDL